MCHENTQVEFEFGSSRIIFGTVMPLGLRKIPIMGHKNTQIKFRYGSISIIFSNVMHLALMFLGVRQFLTLVPYSNFAIPGMASLSHGHISSYPNKLFDRNLSNFQN